MAIALGAGAHACGQIYIGPNVKIGGPVPGEPPRLPQSGPNGVPELDYCCYESPGTPGCPDCYYCLLSVGQLADDPELKDCQDPGVPGWFPPPDAWLCCDDEPKHQQEPSIAAAWWDSRVVLAVFMDNSMGPYPAPVQNAFAVSRDAGQTWERLQRETPFHLEPCPPPAPVFVQGYARTEDDICPQGWNWIGGQGDPCTATALDAANAQGYLYFTGGAPHFARLRLDAATLAPLGPWEATVVPRGESALADKPFVSAEPAAGGVYVHWSAQIDNPNPPPSTLDAIFVTISCEYGAEFFADPAHGCAQLNPSVGIQLSWLNRKCLNPGCNWGTASAVSPNGDVHFIWPVRDYVAIGEPPVYYDQIFWRSLRRDQQGGYAGFEPPLPPTTTQPCSEQPPRTCEVPIIHDHPGVPGAGYGGTRDGPVGDSLNIQTITHPTIGIDPSDPADVCSFSD